MVTESWVGGIGVAKIEGDNTFIGHHAGPASRRRSSSRSCSRVGSPGVARSRRHRDRAAGGLPARVRRAARLEFPVRFLTEDDYFRFDTGFEGGEVHGPRPCSRWSARCAWPVASSDTAARRSPARRPSSRTRGVRRHDLLRAPRGRCRRVRRASRKPPIEASPAIARSRQRPTEFAVVDASDTSVAEAAVDNTALLLGRALMVFALSTAVVGGIAVGPGAGAAPHRHRPGPRGRAGARDDQRPAGGARLLAGWCPPCSPRSCHDRRRGGGAHRADRRHPPLRAAPGRGGQRDRRGSSAWSVVFRWGSARQPRLTGAPTGSVVPTPAAERAGREPGHPGRRLTADRPRPALRARGPAGAPAVPVRSAITGAMVGVAGVVAGLVFVSSLDRLIASPARSAIPYDVGIADVTAEDLEGRCSAARWSATCRSSERSLVVEGLTSSRHAIEALRGSLDIGIERDGCRGPRMRSPSGRGRPRDLGVDAGDTVRPGGRWRRASELAVVGSRWSPPSTARSSASTPC